MTPEERLAKVEEQMIVQAELVVRLERQTDRFQTNTERVLERFAQQIDGHTVELAEFRATVARVLDLMERFIRGQGGGNGNR